MQRKEWEGAWNWNWGDSIRDICLFVDTSTIFSWHQKNRFFCTKIHKKSRFLHQNTLIHMVLTKCWKLWLRHCWWCRGQISVWPASQSKFVNTRSVRLQKHGEHGWFERALCKVLYSVEPVFSRVAESRWLVGHAMVLLGLKHPQATFYNSAWLAWTPEASLSIWSRYLERVLRTQDTGSKLKKEGEERSFWVQASQAEL